MIININKEFFYLDCTPDEYEKALKIIEEVRNHWKIEEAKNEL